MTHPLAAAGATANLCLHDVAGGSDSIYTLPFAYVTELADRVTEASIDDRVRFYFDDGYASLCEVVPQLRDRYPRLRITLALTVALLGTPGRITFDQARELQAAGARIAAHGIDHHNLAKLAAWDGHSPDELRGEERTDAAPTAAGREKVVEQLRGARRQLSRLAATNPGGAAAIDEFVLPYGGWSEAVVELNAERRLYDHLTTIDYAWDRGQRLRPRLMATARLTPAQICAMLRTDGAP